MTGFPEGNFNIVNKDTGRAVFTALGQANYLNYYRLGNKTTYTITDEPKIGLRDAVGDDKESFYFYTIQDPSYRLPVN